MTYNELKKVAQPHIREHEELPSNSFLLLAELHIPFKTQRQCEEDYNGKMTPLYNSPAFLAKDLKGNKIIYFNSNARYWNFYIFHEIAHYILGHECDSPQNEIDADMLACILAAPIENLPSTVKSARDISTLCKIPIDKAEMYWQEIKDIVPGNVKKHKSLRIFNIIFIGIIGSILISWATYNHFKPKTLSETTSVPAVQTPAPTYSSIESPQHTISENQVFVTISGDKYHSQDCPYVKYKTNLIQYDINEAIRRGYEPCKKCNVKNN